MTERYYAKGPMLDGRQNELMAVFIEECAEVIQAATKVQRFGRGDPYPGTEITGKNQLSIEVGHVFTMIFRLQHAGLIDPVAMSDGMMEKDEKFRVYLQHQDTELPPDNDGKDSL